MTSRRSNASFLEPMDSLELRGRVSGFVKCRKDGGPD
jgi:hypothetical protein